MFYAMVRLSMDSIILENTENKPRLKITEIFHSLQGESTWLGLRTTFVRLTGCPLRCTYCDTTYSYKGGQWMNIEQIVAEVESHGTEYVCITGGEPLAQKRCLELVKSLSALGKKISIETDGEEDVSSYVGLAKIILDVKTPGSGEKAEKCFANFSHLLGTDEIKFVLSHREDYEWAKKVCAEYGLEKRFNVLFSPVFGVLSLKDISEWMVADRVNVRLQTQLHKHIWGADQRGV